MRVKNQKKALTHKGYRNAISITQSRALNLMHWLCAHTIKGNPARMPEGLQYHADGLLDWCFDHPGNDPNCMHLSIILSECLLAVGIKAYALGCYPKVYKNDNHVVVHAWLPEESRWILLDPSWDACFTDEAGRILSAPELRGRLASGAPLRLNPGAKAFKGYPGYMAKDMYYFTRSGGKGLSAYLCPAGYPAPWKSPVYATWDSFWQ